MNEFAKVDHAIRRAWERYGIALDRVQIWQEADRIVSGESVLMSKQLDGCEIRLFKVQDKACIIVYDPIWRRIVTFLPKGHRFRGKHKR